MHKTLFWTVTLVTAVAIPSTAIAQILSPQITAPNRPTNRPPAQAQPTPTPAQNVRPTQLSGCQNWVLRLQNVSQTDVMVAPGTARSVEGLAQVMWQIRDGLDRGYCLVRRDGRVTAAVQYTASGDTLHYFPTESDALGGPLQ